jgi:hypothetical protein
MLTAADLRTIEPEWFDIKIRALMGDPAARRLLQAKTRSETMARSAIEAFERRAPRPEFRELLRGAWRSCSSVLVTAAGSGRVKAMFDYADFDLPADLPPFLYRGTRRDSLDVAASGYSWSPCRDVACWYAMADGHINPLVLKVEIARAHVAATFTDTQPPEFVLFDVQGATIDSDAEDWQQGRERFERRLQERGNGHG